MARVRIVPVLSPMQGQNPIDVSQMPAVIGRSTESNVCILDGKVSRRHCELYTDGGQLMIRDLRSTNGTFVNNERIADSRLAPGDTIRLGNTLLLVEGWNPEPGDMDFAATTISAECVDSDEDLGSPIYSQKEGAGRRALDQAG